ncbi:ABC transporter permease [Streptomyces sp. NBC_01221]|uniref:ABC transporter permease n=1 Tax=unclassified Streptomyces TaxID=2593676 RepID=UPI002250F7B0|nr:MULTISPECIES: ABC transporter permease [unclassified Streptomyces]WSP60140.1 ABC transporter permease [Streptomyces sp. NBC_01241]WSU26464.1 ABC transporter permease [Streptomyces sp. NBC_01108]MCX4788573.1 ABC transporter permease [Streptomyces sp. NBC_01221]MCX4795680.1 ABC transporter permease [Streptomyces sp. NBC_01242]WSJ41043.1 ABC transporter permease [Streptomyces sp. NBC_01321]
MLRTRRTRPVEPSVFSFGDLLGESLAGMLQRPARSALTALGTVLGVGTFVAILGLIATTSSQIDGRFNSLTATEVSLEDKASQQNEFAGPAFPPDADDRVERLNGVRSAGVYWPVRLDAAVTVRSAPVGQVVGDGKAEVVAASPGVLEAAEPTLSQGRIYDDLMSDDGAYVAVIGSGVASRLGITTLETRPAVFVGDQPFTVTGIIEKTERKADLLLSVVVPRTTAEKIWGPPEGSSATMLISTELGAAQQVARLAPTALRPDHPEYLKALPPPDPRTLRSGVSGDLSQLFLLLAGICLVIGAVGIANTTLVSVLERTGEIGLRRALGARARHITVQFLAESGVLGALGGLIGTSLGVATVVGVALARDWTPVVHPATAAAAPVIGLVTGVLAGLYPAWRASRIQPAEALRR